MNPGYTTGEPRLRSSQVNPCYSMRMQISDLPIHLISLADQCGVEAVILDGQVCSGKTTTATKFVEELLRKGRRVDRFNIDWFIIDRELRTYRTHPEFLEMARWTDEQAAQQHLKAFLAGQEVSFLAYDRATGRRTLPIRIKRTPGSMLILESIYSLRVAHGAGMGSLPLLPCLFTATEEAVKKRLLQRRTYLDPTQVESELREIFFPSVRRYEEALCAMRIPFIPIEVSDYSAVRIGARPPQ